MVIGTQWSGTIVCSIPTVPTAPTNRDCDPKLTSRLRLSKNRKPVAIKHALVGYQESRTRNHLSPRSFRREREGKHVSDAEHRPTGHPDDQQKAPTGFQHAQDL